jgi:glyoxalase family protein
MRNAPHRSSVIVAAMNTVHGLHHVTAISGPAQENLDFYAGVLGMRLVKKSVNQDDPGTYHLFYADAEGRPGTDLTFFPWAHLAPPRPGHGLASEVALAVPPGALDAWVPRLERYGVAVGESGERFGERTVAFRDPHGMAVALMESPSAMARPFTPWEEGPVPAGMQIRGLHGARLRERELGASTRFLESALGFRRLGTEGGWERWGVETGGSGTWIDLAEAPGERRGAWGVGAIHHLAWRVTDDAEQLAVRAQVAAIVDPTPVIDRFWFHSVYFREPGGVLFELATDGPGFAVDEEVAHLGERLVLPPWLEQHRAEIEGVLPRLAPPAPVEAHT